MRSELFSTHLTLSALLCSLQILGRLVSASMMANFEGWALIVVDMQNDFLAKEGYYARRMKHEQQVRQGRLTAKDMANQLAHPSPAPTRGFEPRAGYLKPIIHNICHVIVRSREQQMPIAYLRAVYDQEFSFKPRFLLEHPERNHYPCKPNTWGGELIDPIKSLIPLQKTPSREKVIEKNTFNGFFNTNLHEFLQRWNTHTVAIVGVETHICVLATAQGASYHQFKTIILKDGVATAREYRANYALNIFRDGFGTTKRSSELF